MLKSALALLLALALTTVATAGVRCRTSKSGSVTYTECVSGDTKTNCRSSRNGSSTYTSCR